MDTDNGVMTAGGKRVVEVEEGIRGRNGVKKSMIKNKLLK